MAPPSTYPTTYSNPRFPDIGDAEELIDTREGVAFEKRAVRPANRYFRVYTTNPFYGPNEICQSHGIPKPFDPYVMPELQDIDQTICVLRISAKLDDQTKQDSRYWWIVTVEYGNDSPPEGIPARTLFGNDIDGSQTQPWEEPPMIRWESETIQRAPQADLLGNAFTNTAQMPFSPPYTEELSRQVLVLTRNQRSYTPESAAEYSWSVNSDDFFYAPPGCAQCYPIHAEHDMRGIVEFWRVTYRVRFGAWVGPLIPDPENPNGGRYESFQPRILDCGLSELAPDPKTLVLGPRPILSIGGSPVSQPFLLDGHGRKQVPGPGGVYAPVFLDFTTRRAKVFGVILTTGVL